MEIDLVCCWVRLDEEYWTTLQTFKDVAPNNHAFVKGRYRDSGELLHSMKVALRLMPWIRKVHIVTNGQVPPKEILDIPKVNLVFHDQFFVNKDHLPNFNYHAIEANLFNLPGLADYYINSADDFFVAKPLSAEDFLLPSGLPVLHIEQHRVPEAPKDIWEDNLAASNHAISRVYGSAVRYPFTHTPMLYVRKYVEEANEIWGADIAATSSCRFREAQNVIFRMLYMYHIIHGKLGIQNVKEAIARTDVVRHFPLHEYRVVFVGERSQKWIRDLEWINANLPTFFCLNDHMGNDEPYVRSVQEKLSEFYEAFKQRYEAAYPTTIASC